mgnify:CR=1 FL=1
MNCVKKYRLIYCLLLLSFSLPLRAQHGWIFRYAANDITTHWRHLASGDTTVIASFEFSTDITDDPIEYYLKGFRPRPITNSTTGWFVDKLQLYLDRGNGVFGLDDSLISSGLANSIPRQSEPDTSIILNFGGDSLLIPNNNGTVFFIVAIVHDWRDEDPENLEIDTTAGGPYGKWFSIKVFNEDITVSPTVFSEINQPTVVQFFYYRALNLPVTIRNNLASAAEEASPRRNMFYPNFLSLDGTNASKAQRIDDLSFYADVFLPESNDNIELSIKSASLQFGFDNRVLEFESVEYGDVWGKDSWFYVDTSLTQVELFDADYPEYTIFQYNAQFNGSETVNNKYEVIDSSSIIRLKFNVIAPGVSPIFIQNIDLRDRWGVRYHTSQNLQNYATVESGMTGERHDAWAKYVLGDFTVSGGDGVSTDGVCDGLVTWEDVALFSDYIWLNSAGSRWYKRFDIASANSISPTDYCPDDTTNFYDLMVIAANYHRTYRGAFHQKPVTRGSDTLEMRLVSEDFSGERQMRIQLQNVSDLQSAHLVVRFNPEELRYTALEQGRWTSSVVENCLLLVPEESLAKGIIDINFAALDQSLGGAGEFLRLNFRKLQSQATTPEIIISDFRDSNCRSLLAVQTSEPAITIPRTFGLLQNFPNPFNARTQIAYTVPEPEGDHYTIAIYDLCGKQVVTLADAFHSAGSYRLQWNGCNREGQAVASGIYFLCLKNSEKEWRRKIMLLR